MIETNASLDAEYDAVCEELVAAMDAQRSTPEFSVRWQRAQPRITAAVKAREEWEASHPDYLATRRASQALGVEATWNL